MTIRFSDFEKELQDGNFAGSSINHRTAPKLYAAFGKRLFDVVFVVLSLPVTLPLILLLCIVVALDGGKPIYTSVRVGKGGRSFRMLKLRTMVHDADARLEHWLAANPQARAEWSETQKLREDPRITRVGRFLRKTSMDELPQLLNILAGHMSIVGPRPMLPEQRSLYPGRSYYALRPGLTGPWQVSARNNSSFRARAEYDSAYERQLSLWTDIRMIFLTVGVVLKGTGY